MLPMSTSRHCQAHLALLAKIKGHQQAHLTPPVKMQFQGHHHMAHPMGTSSCRIQPCGVVAWKCKGLDVVHVEKTRGVLQIPLQASDKKLLTNQATQVSTFSTGGGQLRSAV